MAYRAYTGHAEIDIDDLRAFGICERCGQLWNRDRLLWQMDYRGSTLQNLNILVCPSCLDKPNPTSRTVLIPPDPDPVFNPRPPSSNDLLSVRVSEDEVARVSEDGSVRVTEESN